MNERGAEPNRPFWIRIAGLPARAATELGDAELFRGGLALAALVDAWDEARGRLALELHTVIGRTNDRALRRKLLTLRRQVHNDRDLSIEPESAVEEVVRQECSAGRRLLQLDEELRSARLAFAKSYASARRTASARILDWTDDPKFFRALALASPTLAASLRRHGSDWNPKPRKRRKAEEALLRYVLRAATKLSPFSAMTRVVAGWTETKGSQHPRWPPGLWEEHSFVRIQRYLAEQLQAGWMARREVRLQLQVVVNSSRQHLSGHDVMLSPMTWRPNPGLGSTEAVASALVRVPSSPLLDQLRAQIESEPMRLGELQKWFAQAIDTSLAEAMTFIDRLLDVGWLELLLPWPSNTPSLEARMLDHMEQDHGDRDVTRCLTTVRAIEIGFKELTQPETATRQIMNSLDDAWTAVTRATDFSGLRFQAGKAQAIHEDVLWAPRTGAVDGTRFDHATATGLLTTLDPWFRALRLADRRFDMLFALAELGRRRWPTRRHVGVLELFIEAKSIWSEFRHFEKDHPKPWGMSFDPMLLPEVSNLARWRKRVDDQMREQFTAAGEEQVQPEDLARTLAELPAHFGSEIDPCAMLQPLANNDWVLNRIFEGTGRYGSRFLALLEEDTHERWVAAHRPQRFQQDDGEGGLWLDLGWTRGDTLGLHPSMTELELRIPGQTPAPEASTIPLPSLRIDLGKPPALPRLLLGNRPVTPVYLGGAAGRFLPPWLQFLGLWGPRDLPHRRPPSEASIKQSHGIECSLRSQLGSIVLARRRWRIPRESIALSLRGVPAEDYARLLHWWTGNELPTCFYWIESVGSPSEPRYKPQYSDLSSPLCFELFSRIALQDEIIVIEEALPTPKDFPIGPQRENRAYELMLDGSLISQHRPQSPDT